MIIKQATFKSCRLNPEKSINNETECFMGDFLPKKKAIFFAFFKTNKNMSPALLRKASIINCFLKY